MNELSAEVLTAIHIAELAREAGLPIPAKLLPILEEAAAPWPARWLLSKRPGVLSDVEGVHGGDVLVVDVEREKRPRWP